MDSVPPTETAAANSLNTLMRMLGTSSCSAFVAAVATSLTISADGQVLPAASAYTVIYVVAAAAGLAGTVIAALTPGARAADAVPTTAPAPARTA
jgi:hypothetical protein